MIDGPHVAWMRLQDGLSIKEIARRTRLARNTVKRGYAVTIARIDIGIS